MTVVITRIAKPLSVALLLAIVGSLGGCDTMSNLNPFKDKETPLPGERRPVPRVAPPPPDQVPQPLSALPDETSARIA